MPRLRRLAATAALAAAAALAGGAAATPREPGPRSPATGAPLNVVLVVSDDERVGLPHPTVDELLAARGVTFTNAFVTTPECCPSRAGILTGQYAHTNGVVSNAGAGAWPAFPEESSLAVWLQAAGYDTALVGKYLNGYAAADPRHVPPGWTHWAAIASTPFQRYYDYRLNVDGRLVSYGAAKGDYSTTALTDRAVRFLEHADDPFFLYFAPLAPHLPATPPPQRARAPLPPFRPPPSFDERDVSDKPWRDLFPSRMRPGAVSYIAGGVRVRQLEALDALDASVGRLVGALRRRGLLDRTLIVYISDNGFLWGEHRLGGKLWPYEESIHVPLVVRTPWPEVWGRRDDRLVLNIDLASTIAELAGVEPPIAQDGRSLVPLLRGERPPWRSGFLIEYLGGSLLRAGGAPPYRGVRTRRYAYVEYENGWRELYDLRLDPYELRNRARDPAYAEVRRALERRLAALRSDGTAGRDATAAASSGTTRPRTAVRRGA